MRENRKALMFLTDGLIAVYEGDIITMFISGKGNAVIRWYPKSPDFKKPDRARLGRKSKYRRLDGKGYDLLVKTGRLKPFPLQGCREGVYRVGSAKRKPLLRLPLRGLAPRRV
jgi:hypothetical protein